MKIAILTLVKNNEKELLKYDFFLKEFKKNLYVDSYILEYGSIDNSKKLAKDIAKIVVEEQDISYQNNVSIEYLVPICKYLNVLKNLALNSYDYDYIIFTDIATITWPSIESIKSSIDILEHKSNLYAVSALGLSEYRANLIYYDIWSLIIKDKIQNHKIWLKDEIYDDMTVDSAYGGLCIYKASILKDIDFFPLEIEGYICSGYGLKRLSSEFGGLNLKLRKKNFYNFINKKLILYK